MNPPCLTKIIIVFIVFHRYFPSFENFSNKDLMDSIGDTHTEN